jgi:hypothetical protein
LLLAGLVRLARLEVLGMVEMVELVGLLPQLVLVLRLQPTVVAVGRKA